MKIQPMKSIVFYFLLFFNTNLVIHVFAWGPLTHQTFSCHIQNVDRNATCFQGFPMYSMTLGNGAPDSVKYLEPKFHSFEFAAWQYQFAKSYPPTAQFKPIDFAIGFGYHLSQDVVGHHKNSYLSPQHNRWMQFAVDSRKVQTSKPDRNIFQWRRYNDDAIKFLYDSNVFYANKNPSYKPHPIEKLAETVKAFDTVIGAEVELARFNTGYKNQQMEYDPCKPSNEVEMEANFKRAYEWSVLSSKYFLSLIEKDENPRNFDGLIHKFVDAMFARQNGTLCL
jgi:hypothetical protein